MGVLHRSGDRYHWMADTYPAEDVSLRSAAPDNVVIIDQSVPAGRVIGAYSAPTHTMPHRRRRATIDGPRSLALKRRPRTRRAGRFSIS